MTDIFHDEHLSKALTEMFPDGGETYTREEVRWHFENSGVDVTHFDELLEVCIANNWIIDCGNNAYTR